MKFIGNLRTLLLQLACICCTISACHTAKYSYLFEGIPNNKEIIVSYKNNVSSRQDLTIRDSILINHLRGLNPRVRCYNWRAYATTPEAQIHILQKDSLLKSYTLIENDDLKTISNSKLNLKHWIDSIKNIENQ